MSATVFLPHWAASHALSAYARFGAVCSPDFAARWAMEVTMHAIAQHEGLTELSAEARMQPLLDELHAAMIVKQSAAHAGPKANRHARRSAARRRPAA